jgi:hypothetical protein
MTAPWRTKAYSHTRMYAVLRPSSDVVRLRPIERSKYFLGADRDREFVTYDGWRREVRPGIDLHKFVRRGRRAGRLIYVEPDLHAFSFSDDKVLPFFVEGE